jgi:hypothetical protein
MESHLISGWLCGNYLKSFEYIDDEAYDIKWLWLSVDHRVDLHEADEFPLTPFDQSRRTCRDYLDKACAILGREKGRPGRGPTDAATQAEILRQLGRPPQGSYSIYIMTVADADGTNERAVYVGKTNATTHRFRSGHMAISKLHHPRYDGLKKSLYFACASAVNDDDNTFPVEWINPLDQRDSILSSVEYQLIYYLQPELNDHGKQLCLVNPGFHITTQSNVQSGGFLDANMIGPDRPF